MPQGPAKEVARFLDGLFNGEPVKTTDMFAEKRQPQMEP
jgi:hypothetical protein